MDEHTLDSQPLLHVANVLYLVSYSLRDILWLRVLTVAAMLCLAWCYWCCNENFALGWQGAFLSINLFQIALLIRERRPVQLTDMQRKLHEGPLNALTERQVQRFTETAQHHIVDSGEALLAENQPLEDLILILSGEAKVIAGGQEIAVLHAGQFAGEMSFLTGSNTSADVIADGRVEYVSWSESYVSDLVHRDHELGSAIQAALGTDLVGKLLNSRQNGRIPR